MSRRADRWGDDEDLPARPRRREGMSPVAIVLLVMGGVFVVGAVTCGGLMWLGYRKAEAVRAEAVEADRIEAEARVEAMDREPRANAGPVRNRVGGPAPDEVPPPKPGPPPAADPPPQPKPTAFDQPGDPDRWRVLFRSKKPELWNTNTQAGDDFAIPLRSTPADAKYLRLRRMDNGEAIILPMTRGRVGRADPQGRAVRWNGEGKDEHGGYHLGIAEGPVARFTEGQGTIGVLMDGWDANPGSGFGHAHHVEDGGQRYSWKGKEIPATVFEVAVTSGELTEAERKLLRD